MPAIQFPLLGEPLTAAQLQMAKERLLGCWLALVLSTCDV